MQADVEVVFHFDEARILYNGYRPIHRILPNYLTTGLHIYNNPGEEKQTDKGTVTFISPEYYPHSLSVGQTIHFYDGNKHLGYIEIVKVLNKVLEA